MQQINLYLPEFRPERKPVRAEQMLWIVPAFLLVLILWSFYTAHGNRALERELAEQQQRVDELEAEVEQLTAARPEGQRGALERRISRLEDDIRQRQRIREAVSRENLGNEAGFSAQMEALGRQSLRSLSLESFSLRERAGGTYAELRGLTHSADQVPLYLQRLRSQDSFAQVRFGVMKIERDPSGPLRFSVAQVEQEDE